MKTMTIMYLGDLDLFMDSLAGILVPIASCVVLPLMIVWMTNKTRRLKMEQQSALAMKSLENGQPLDPKIFDTPEVKTPKVKKSTKERIFNYLKIAFILMSIGLALIVGGVCFLSNASLLFKGISIIVTIPFWGLILFFLGLAYLIFFFITRKHFANEIESESKKDQD